MSEIFRIQLDGFDKFKAPKNITFDWQEQRNAFSFWYKAGDEFDTEYIILGTGLQTELSITIIQTVILPDGFHAFHLCKINSK